MDSSEAAPVDPRECKDFTQLALSGYLGGKFGTRVTVEEIARLGRGASRETWSVTYRTHHAADPCGVILRVDPPSGSTDTTPLDQEYFVYERLGQTAVPIAKVLWWEDDPAWLGRPFYVRQRIEGNWSIPHFSDPDPQYDDLRIRIAKEHIGNLARVHDVDWRALGLDQRIAAPASEEQAAHVYVDTVRARYERVAVESLPILIEACEWLHDHALTAPRLCLCKGTNGYGEEVFRGDSEVALSDWEEVSIGHPAADFAFMQGFLNEIKRGGAVIWSLQHALDFYGQLTGLHVSSESVYYYHLIRALNMLVMCHNAGAAAQRTYESFIRQVWTGTEATHIAKHVLAAGIGILPQLDPSRFAQLIPSIDMS
jgi:aminoglycoside phosphotransferase (APT) family kinase protein